MDFDFGSNDGETIITHTLTDGDSATDIDNAANGTIVDPGALVTGEASDNDSDGTCFIQSLL